MKQATVTAFVSLLIGLKDSFFVKTFIDNYKSVPKIFNEILGDRALFSRERQYKCQANENVNTLTHLKVF